MTREEFAHYFRLGIERGEYRKRMGGQHRYGWKPGPEEERLSWGFGLVSEVFVAEATGREWLSSGNTPDKPGAGDVTRCCVRWGKLQHYRLLIHPDDGDELYGVLVVGARFEELRIVGWRGVRACKEREWWKEKGQEGMRFPCFAVPQEELFHIDGLNVRPIDLAALGAQIWPTK